MLILNSGGNSYRQLVGALLEQKVNKCELNMNGQQEREHKAHSEAKL